MKLWKDIGFEIEITGDESPSLRLLSSVDPLKDRGESMHHSGGAWAETLLIYGQPIKAVLQKIEKPQFLIVGLGLGYIELTVAREALILGKSSDQVGLITSYESVPELREFFYLWLHQRKDLLSLEVWNTYELVLSHIIKDTELKPEQVRSFLRDHFANLKNIQSALAEDVTLPSRYHCILYDAFSSKTSPHLWEESFLVKLLDQGVQAQSVLSTYACKGSLKRALKHVGFEVLVREGFQGKRNSTLGTKNIQI